VTSVLHYQYDGAGRLRTPQYPDGRSEGLVSYDGAGRLTHVQPPGGGDTFLSYNGAGQQTEADLPNGGVQQWGYDLAGRLVSTSWQAGSTSLFTQTATLDSAGQRKTLADSWGTTTYGYDLAGRLTSAVYPDGSAEANQYDPAGNRTVITNTVTLTTVTSNLYDHADQLLSSSASANGGGPALTTYAYDGNGNQTGSTGPTGLITNTYNLQNALVQVAGPQTSVRYVRMAWATGCGSTTRARRTTSSRPSPKISASASPRW
jgi:YD repeat-containing protein